VSDRVPPPRKPGPRRAPSGVISTTEVYPQDLFLDRVGWSRGALSVARKAGLRVITVGGRNYVRGRDWDEFLSRQDANSGGSDRVL
jgi:hypothetical protein